MKKIKLVVLLLFLISNIYGINIKEILTYKGTGWLYPIPKDKKDGYYAIHFSENNEFDINIIDRESEIQEKGIYEINENKILLIFNKPFGIFKSLKQEFILHSYESFNFKYFLVNNNGIKFFNYHHILEENDVITLSLSTGIYKVFILKPSDYITTENLNMRAEPTILSKKVYIVEAYDVFRRKAIISDKSPLPKEKICRVIGRTLNKYKVNDNEDYWYLLDFFPSPVGNNDYGFVLEDVKNENDLDAMVSNAWVFGKYIRKKD